MIALSIQANPSMAAAPVWISATTSGERPIRAILRAPDRITEFGPARTVSDTGVVDICRSDLSDPRTGDLIVIGAESFTLQGEPTRDRERLLWALGPRPERCRRSGRGAWHSVSPAALRTRAGSGALDQTDQEEQDHGPDCGVDDGTSNPTSDAQTKAGQD